jgi:DNA-binding transcriptional regulator YiaG
MDTDALRVVLQRARQSALARVLGVSSPTFSRWESGHRAPKGPRLRAYLDILDTLRREPQP